MLSQFTIGSGGRATAAVLSVYVADVWQIGQFTFTIYVCEIDFSIGIAGSVNSHWFKDPNRVKIYKIY